MSFLKRETPHNPYGYAGLLLSIIPYQEIIGNYNNLIRQCAFNAIISYFLKK